MAGNDTANLSAIGMDPTDESRDIVVPQSEIGIMLQHTGQLQPTE